MSVILKKYGVATTLVIPVIKAGATDFSVTGDWTPAAGDVKISKDDGNVANIATLPVAVGGTGSALWKFSFSASEMTASRIVVQVIDSATKAVEDQAIMIDTYGNALAEHSFDLNVATQPVNLIQIEGVAQSATDLKDFADEGYDPATNKVQGVVLVDTTTTNTDMRGTDGVDTAAMRGTNSAALASVCTEARLAELDGANLPADVAAVKVDTAAILIDTGTTLDTKLDDIQGATFSSATDSLEAIRNRGDAAWTTGAGGSSPILLQNTTIATLASQISFTLTAGSVDDDAYNGCVIVITDVSTSTQKAVGVVSDYVGSTKTITLLNDPGVFTIAATDTVDILADRSLKPFVDNRFVKIDSSNKVEGVVLVDTTTSNTDMRGTDGVDTATMRGTDGVDTAAMRGTDSAALASVCTEARLAELDAANLPADVAAVKVDTAAILIDTADMQPKLGAPAGASISADIAAVKVDTTAILIDTSTTLDTKLNDIQGATFSSATDSLEAIRDRGDAAWTTGAGGSGSDSSLLQNTTIATLATQTSFTLTNGSADDDVYNGAKIIITDSATATQKAVGTVLDYVGATKTVTLAADPAIFTMAVGDDVDIIAVPLQLANGEVVLASNGVDKIFPEAGLNMRQSIALIGAGSSGKSSGLGGTNPKYQGMNNTTERINATTDKSGNRSAVTLTPPA